MNYQETCVEYAKALMAGLTAPSEALSNQYAAKASQYGATLSASSKASIQQSVKVQAMLRDFLANGGINS